MEQADIDVVSIEGLSVDTIIGVYDWEKEKKQTLTLDIQMSWDNQTAALMLTWDLISRIERAICLATSNGNG